MSYAADNANTGCPPSVKKETLVSVIITTYNRSQYLKEAIASVLAVDQKTFSVEIIVVDDGSTDDTAAVARQYPVKYLLSAGRGMDDARNTGLRAATGQFITLLDDDDLWLPGHIIPHLEMFEQNPAFGAVLGQAQLVEQDGTPFGAPFPAGPLSSGWIFEDFLSYNPQIGTLVTRAAVAREVGEMDGTLAADSDWDWILRVAKRYPVGRIEEPVMLFRQRSAAEEEEGWRRFPSTPIIFHRHARSLGLIKSLQLRPTLWRLRGLWASRFLRFARQNYLNGQRQRARRSLYYAFRSSLPHTIVGCFRSWPFARS